MNLGGGGFTVPQENEFNFRSPWIPSTPGKPISTPSHSILLDGHGNRLVGGNWQQQQQQLVGYPIGYVQDIGNNNEKVQNFNPRRQLDLNVGLYNWDVGLPQKNKMINNIAGTYAQKFGNDSTQWNSTSPLAEILAMKNAAYVASGDSTATSGLHLGNRSQITNLQAQVNGNWKQQPGTTGMSLTHQNTGQLSGLWSNSRNLANVPQDGFPVPHRANYNPNSPPRTVIETTSSMTNSFPFAPVTPDQTKKSEKNWLSEVLNHYVEESLSQEGEKQDKLVMSTTDENIERHSDELLQNLVDSSSAANLLPIEETNKKGDQLIDLNKTPEQKATKRRKHRPKVVVEGKPKRTPRPVTTKNPTPQQNPTGKRKYVRKNAVKASEPKPADNTGETVDSLGETIDPTVGSAAKSCRRMLNFDLEKATGDNQGNLVSRPEEIQGNMSHNLNLNSQARELCSKIYSISRTESAAEMNQRDGSLLREQQTGAKCNLTYQMQTNYLSMAMQHPAAASKGIESNNVNDIACNGKTQCAVAKQISQRNGYNPVNSHHIHAEGISEIFLQAKNTHDSLGRAGQQMLQSSPQSVLQNWSDMNGLRGSKREYHCTIEKRQPNAALNTLLRPDIFQVDEFNESNTCRGFSETQKKRKIGNAPNPNVTMEPSVTTIEDGSRQHKQGGGIDVNPYLFSSKINHGMLKAYIESSNAPRKTRNEVNNYIGDWYIPHVPAQHMFPKQHSSPELVSRMPSTVQKQSQGSTQGHCSVNEKRSSLLPLPQRAPISGRGKGAETVSQNTSAKMLTAGPTLLNFSCNPDKVPHEKEANHNQAFPCRTEGSSERQKYPIPIDEIISQLKGLTLDGTLNGIGGQEQNALVPYKGGGTIVPFEIKKRKPRPKVDLDPETERIWKLLMGKEGSEATDRPDKDKEKWWEEERKVFRGRADSFIARMHLVQGDRRFSQWKGSVVDSVIGVFLTQNVSDHLSSSAFMSLAAKFPLKSASDNKTCSRCETSIVVEEPEASILDPDDTLRQYEKLPSQLVYNERSITSQGSLGQRRGSLTSETETTTLLQAGNCRTDEEVISMQGFFRSFIDQVSGVQSFSSCNSEAKNPAAMSKVNTNHVSTPRDLQMEKVAMFQEFHNCENGSPQVQESSKYGHQKPKDTEFSTQNQMFNTVDNLSSCFKSTYPVCSSNSSAQVPVVHSSNHWLYKTPDLCLESHVLGRDCTASWPSNASKITNAMDPNWSIQRVELDAESICNPPVQKNGLVRHQESPRVNPYALKSHHTVQQQSNFHPGPCRETDQYSCNSSQHDSTSATGPMVTAEIQASRQKNMQQDLNSPKLIQETVGEASSETGITTTKGRKGNTEGGKKKEFDWDSLRKQAQSHNKRERSKATMDSLDYEAVRCANVSKISNAIKERGMNNMLAERIQDFLNRLVRDHGSIDLEWLRDAPPDKAKDYLLSVRGLGLKSVECVRLLTLHHLAFPVDTNVGRIAVRLGWVPLQPLPESLQLHLLELYPVLESIQKYLWPRLCKLDQRTLYELHYQMITFGKVFCTKSKPNCNACPMRGECRHFASAFASARLALPGPEENSIMHSSIPVAAVGNPAVVINPMPLPPSENNPLGEAMSSTRNCEPIIEVPATPEPECAEISESDIEDAFYEDPDEIPTIRLNIEEFTQNLQNYMQENNLEVQEGDMSKALVALNPAAASIPTPKLKNVSRLRTEHQVYELPDSHCLLKGLERREPDDPSPYLLAIWTPGETANSTQAPESQCESQDPSKLCNDMTCFSCNSIREANSQTVRGTILIPCRTAMRGSFPLNGTYFQVNEMFADHDSSLNPIDVPRAWIWNLPRRTVYFGTSVSTIFKGLSTEGIQYCFWRGFVCVRGFDQKTRAPRPLMARLHFPASKLAKRKNENKRHADQDADLITGKGSANQDLSIQKA